MTTAEMLANCREVAAQLRQSASAYLRFTRPHLEKSVRCSVQAEAIEQLIASHPLSQPLPKFDERGADAQIACTVASKARRQLEAMGQPRQHVAEAAIRGIVRRGRAS